MFSEKALKVIKKAEAMCSAVFKEIEDVALVCQKKVLDAFRAEELALSDIASSSGYGNDDRSKGKLSSIYAKSFGAEAGIVSPLISSGTHALTIMLFGLLRPDDVVISVTGKPYDTLQGVIHGKGNGSLADFKIKFMDIDLVDNDFDYDNIKKQIKKHSPKMIYVQRSRGYSARESLTVTQIEKLAEFVKKIDDKIIIAVDNCYGEFVEKLEPVAVGADIMAGSLIKNAGAGIAPTGGYIVGKEKLIELVSSRFIAPNIGLEIGSYAGNYTPFFLGAFFAPHVVSNALKANLLFGAVLKEFGIKSSPKITEVPHDLVRTIEFGDKNKLIEFCQTIQSVSPVDSNVTLMPWKMPGYEDEVIMASGSFTQGSSIELSADGPIRPPYYCYLQGSLTYEHAKLAALEYVEKQLNK